MTYLQNHEIFSSADLDELSEFVTSVSAPHEFELNDKRAALDARFAAAQCGDLNLMHATFGNVCGVKSPEENTDGLLLYMLTRGAGSLQHGANEIEFSVGKGVFRDTALPVRACQKDLGTFVIPLSKEKLKAHARSLIGDEVDLMGLIFDPEIDFTAPGGAVVRNTIYYIADALDGPLRELKNPIISAQLEDMLLTQLLTLLPNSYQDALSGRPATPVLPYHIKRARDYIHANLGAPIALADLATVAGCGYRTLQAAFNEAYGMSPMSYLRQIRLQKAHAEFLSGTKSGTISEIAQKWGFAHMGRFSQSYACEFGELPSETIRKRS